MEVCYFMNFRLVHKILLVLAQCNIPNIECIDIIMEEKEEEAKGKEQDVDNKMNKDEDEKNYQTYQTSVLFVTKNQRTSFCT